MASDNEQINLVHELERLYAEIHRLRDVVYGDNWDRDLSEATFDANVAMKNFNAAYSKLV